MAVNVDVGNGAGFGLMSSIENFVNLAKSCINIAQTIPFNYVSSTSNNTFNYIITGAEIDDYSGNASSDYISLTTYGLGYYGNPPCALPQLVSCGHRMVRRVKQTAHRTSTRHHRGLKNLRCVTHMGDDSGFFP
jgi:hypothetical protein